MPTYRVFFFGLIMHIGPDPKWKHLSAVVHDGQHESVLYYGECKKVSLTDVKAIWIRGIPQKVAKAKFTLREFTPRVAQIMKGTIKAEAEIGKYATLFHHVGGKIRVVKLYEMLVRHLCDKKIVRCGFVAYLTMLSLKTKYPLHLEAGCVKQPMPSAILIANLDKCDKNPIAGNDNPDFKKYKKLMTGCEDAITMNYDCIPPSSMPSIPYVEIPLWILDILKSPAGERTSAHPECGNSAWP